MSEEKKSEEKLNWKKEIWEWVKIILAAAAIAFLVNHFLIANSVVPSGSMETTIMPGDRIIGSRLSYRFGEPERGDIVIFDHENGPSKKEIHYVKRIIGLPGETLDIRDGHVYINGSDTPLEEPYLKEEMDPSENKHFEIPEGCYFMMGDNRNLSADARGWSDPYVPKSKIIAKVQFRYFPKPGKVK